jgi:hypothetical protein
MKKFNKPLAYCAALVLGLLLPGLSAGSPVYAASVQVTLPNFSITLNGAQIDNAARRYPLIVCKDITYFPMTYDDCRFLGLESYYTAQTGLDIRAAGASANYRDDRISGKNPRRMTAQTAAFPVRVNGKAIDNSTEAYPLLLYKNITYFPLTWRFAADEFNWEYTFDDTNGLVIYSAPSPPPAPEQAAGLVSEAAAKLQGAEWLNATLRAYSRYENRVYGLVSEYRPDAALWYRTVEPVEPAESDQVGDACVTAHYLARDGHFYTSEDGEQWTPISDADFTLDTAVFRERLSGMTAALEQLPFSGFTEDRLWTTAYDGYLCMAVTFDDAFPSPLPQPDGDGTAPGTVNRHEFFFDLQERLLRAYRVAGIPFLLGENGEPYLIPVPTTYYHVVDLSYQQNQQEPLPSGRGCMPVP